MKINLEGNIMKKGPFRTAVKQRAGLQGEISIVSGRGRAGTLVVDPRKTSPLKSPKWSSRRTPKPLKKRCSRPC